MTDKQVTVVTLPGSARDTLKKLWADDVSAQKSRFSTEEQRERVVAEFMKMDTPDDPVRRKVYFEDLVRNQVSSIQAGSARSGLNAVKEWWETKDAAVWDTVLGAGLVLKIEDGTYVPLQFATARDFADVYKRRNDEIEAASADLSKLNEIAVFFSSIMKLGETLGSLRGDRVAAAIEILV